MGLAWTPGAPPFFHARVGDPLAISGSPSGELGYRYSVGPGQPDGGNWVAWHWDGAALTVTNDRFGAYPLYYAATADSVALSPSVDRLLALGAPTELDLDALAVFLAVGYYVGSDTPFAAIRALPPAATLSWCPSGLELRSEPPRFSTAEMTREMAIEGTVELVRAAVRRCVPRGDAPFLMPISGGRDSRHILLELLRLGRRPEAGLTVHQYPTDWGGDAPYAAGLCTALGVPHRTLQPGPLIAAEWRKNGLSSYGADEHAWFLPVVEALKGRTPYTYDGLGGGAVLHREFMTRSVRRAWRDGGWDELAARLGKKVDGRPRYEPLLSPAMRHDLTADRAATRIRSALERYRDADDPYLTFVLYERTRREVALAPNAMLAGGPTVYTPFTDPDFLGFAASIPDELIDERLHDDIIASVSPAMAQVPFVPKRRPAPDRTFLRAVDRDLLRLLRQRSDGSLVDRRRLMARAAADSVRGDGWFAQGRRAVLTTYLVQLERLSNGTDLPN